MNEAVETNTTETEQPAVTEAGDATSAEETQETTATEPPAEGEQTVAADSEATDAEEDDDEEPQDLGEKAKHRRKGGWKRQVEKLRLENEWMREQLMTRPAPAPQPAAPPRELTPDEKAVQAIDNFIEQRIAQREAMQRQQQAAVELQKKEAAARAKYEDYGDAVRRVYASGMSKAHVDAILTADDPAEIMYAVARDPDVLAQYAALPPARAYIEVGRLAERLSASTATPKTPVAARKPAPAPISPVKGRGPTNVKPVSEMSYEEYDAYRRKGGR